MFYTLPKTQLPQELKSWCLPQYWGKGVPGSICIQGHHGIATTAEGGASTSYEINKATTIYFYMEQGSKNLSSGVPVGPELTFCLSAAQPGDPCLYFSTLLPY